ncbi:MAG: VCBS repeat-containing protein [Acidobacteria bacterium]|nr:MAG: VCBS repeat-containing protein [Acidobacteriota bacterium]
MTPVELNRSRTVGSSTRRGFLTKLAGTGLLLAEGLETRGAVQRQESQVRTKRLPRWKARRVAEIPHGYQVAVADLNEDGRLDILALSSEESIVEWYENPSWTARPITTRTTKNISLAPLFRPGYPSHGVALATEFALEDNTRGGGLWWATPPGSLDLEWPLRWIGRLPASHRLRWADLDGDGRLELVDAPIVGPGAKPPDYSARAPLTWYREPEVLLRGHAAAAEEHGTGWEPHLIDNSLTVVHGLGVVDWDGDGRDELLTASFEGVHLFHAAGRGDSLRWTRTHLAAGDQDSKPSRGSSEIGMGRLGRQRLLATIEPWHGDKVVVYLEPGSKTEPGKLWERHVIDASFRDGHALACADLDGDDRDEIVAGFRGPGTSLYIYYALDSSGTKWDRQELDTQMAASGVVVADVNGDGRLDVVAVGASTGNVKWYENTGDGI